jgi:hypothetical protein
MKRLKCNGIGHQIADMPYDATANEGMLSCKPLKGEQQEKNSA